MNIYNNKLFIINIFLLIAVLFTFALRLLLSDKVSVAGEGYAKIETQKDALTKENEYLETSYYDMTSLQEISQRANEEGYVNASLDYITPDDLASR